MRIKLRVRFGQLIFATAVIVVSFMVHKNKVQAAACVPQATDYGTMTSTVSIPAGTYRVWSRIQIPTTSSNSYLLEIDGTTCYTVGGNTSIPINTWTWVDYQGGTSNNKINHTFTAIGNHTIKMIGNSDGVLLDRIIFTQDTTSLVCNPPTDKGDLCADQATNVAPTFTSFSSSSNNVNIGTNFTLTANANDSDGTVNSISIYETNNATPLKTCNVSTASASCAVALSKPSAGTYTFNAKVTDNDGSVTTSSNVVVTVIPVVSQLPGDVNGSGTVTLADLNIVLSHWGQTGQSRANGDLTGDGNVTLADLNQVLFSWTR